jgi:hypothetical protein
MKYDISEGEKSLIEWKCNKNIKRLKNIVDTENKTCRIANVNESSSHPAFTTLKICYPHGFLSFSIPLDNFLYRKIRLSLFPNVTSLEFRLIVITIFSAIRDLVTLPNN